MTELIYFETPNYCIPYIGKVASTTTARVIVETFYPELIDFVKNNAGFPNENWDDTPIWQLACPKTLNPTKPIVSLMRDPVLRFKSAIVQTGIVDPSQAIQAIRNNQLWQFPHLSDAHTLKDNPHFKPQSSWFINQVNLFKFPDHLNDFFNFIGITSSIPNLNQSNVTLNLPNNILNLVELFYSKDISIYNNIVSPNTIYNPLNILQ